MEKLIEEKNWEKTVEKRTKIEEKLPKDEEKSLKNKENVAEKRGRMKK